MKIFEIRSQESEVRSQKAEGGRQEPEAGSWKVEGGSQEPEGGRWKVEVRSQKSGARSQKAEGGRQEPEVGSWKVEVRSQKSGARSQKAEGGRQEAEVGSWKVEVRSQKSGARSQKAEGGRWKVDAGRWKVEGGSQEPEAGRRKAEGGRGVSLRLPARLRQSGSFAPPVCKQSAFTMVEIAISLAIIGIALVAIIGVLPLGMNVQRDNREATVINQDATFFIEAIRNGARGMDDLTNYVYAITNYWTQYGLNGPTGFGTNGYTFTSSFPLTNGLNIVGLLSTPEFTDLNFNPTNNLFSGGYSNHVVAYVRSISGPAVEKPPQDNQIIQADSFGYRVICENAPEAADTNIFNVPDNNPNRIYSDQLAANLHELRLSFLWPVQPNGAVGSGRQTFRALVAGQIAQTNSLGQMLYFYQSQSFTNTP